MPKLSLPKRTGPSLNRTGPSLHPATPPAAPVDVEAVAREELNDVQQGFKDRATREDQRFVDATDSEYWIALCFQTREQKEDFLREAGLTDLGDKYLDGMQVAKRLGIALVSRIPSLPRFKIDPTWSRLTRR